jgi:hypothetical protein
MNSFIKIDAEKEAPMNISLPSPSISVDPVIPDGLPLSRAHFRFTGCQKIRNGGGECKRSIRAGKKVQYHMIPKIRRLVFGNKSTTAFNPIFGGHYGVRSNEHHVLWRH